MQSKGNVLFSGFKLDFLELGNGFPTTQYVHYKAYVLNLAIVHSSSDVSVRTMMATVQEITFAFHYSSKKLQNLSKNYVGL